MEHGNQFLPDRKNLRARFHDYSGGLYFVTVCTKNKKHYFGKIQNGNMNYTVIGNELVKRMEELSGHYPYMRLCQYVVMPNHFHAIIHISDAYAKDKLPLERTALSVVMGGLKQSVTMFTRKKEIEFEWQRNYHDRIIRSQQECNRISEYITNNIGNWEADCFYNM